MTTENSDLWIFGYGSLMWRPGFDFVERLPVRLIGYHRAFCVWSHRYRGTPERPGLVLGLDRGGSCLGIAYRIAPEKRDAVLGYLHEREMITGVYNPRDLSVFDSVSDRRVIAQPMSSTAATAICGGLTVEQRAALIIQGVGTAGLRRDYLANTVAHLIDLGMPDRRLGTLLNMVDASWRAILRSRYSRRTAGTPGERSNVRCETTH